eukprot:4785333-Amphidinium_carterae.1
MIADSIQEIVRLTGVDAAWTLLESYWSSTLGTGGSAIAPYSTSGQMGIGCHSERSDGTRLSLELESRGHDRAPQDSIW